MQEQAIQVHVGFGKWKRHGNEESDPNDETVAKITHVAAMCCVQVLWQYLVKQGFSFSNLYHTTLAMCTNKVLSSIGLPTLIK